MNELSPEQVKLVTQTINRHSITYSHLREDLIDHVCCIVEEGMGEGKSFQDTLSQVLENIGIDGFKKVQEQTILCINQTYQNMKKLMKVTGIISTILITIGALFKIQHWPGASITLTLGYFLLLIAFLPSLMYVLYAENKAGKNRFVYISGFIGFFFLFAGMIFKIQHWPGASIAMGSGVFLIVLFFLPALLNKLIRETEDRVFIPIIYLGIACVFIYFFAFYFKIMHWPFAGILTILSMGLIALVLLPWYVSIKMKRAQAFEGSFIYIIIALCQFVLLAALINLNVSANVQPQYSNTGKSLNTINKYLEARFSGHYNSLIQTNSMKDSAEITKIKKLHGESVSLINFLANKKTEVINQFCEGDNNLKTSTDENAKIAYVRENGMQIIGRLQVAGSIQSFDSIAQTKFEQYYKAGSILLDKETKLLVFLRNCLSPGLRLNKPEENSDVYFTEMSNVAQVVSSLDYLQIAVYNAEEIVLNKLVDKQNTRHQVQTSAIK